jgi:RimJ/RimL family protein N-acetyltransferase
MRETALPTLNTPRLLLRPPGPDDAQAYYEALAESILDLRRFLSALPWVAAEPSLEGARQFCERALANHLARKDFPFLMLARGNGRLVGVCGLHRPDWTVPKFEVGYWCRASAQGEGFVAEALQAVCAHAFHHHGAMRLEAITDEENLASRRVAERGGFTLEGVLRRHQRASDGSLRNICVHTRLADGGESASR